MASAPAWVDMCQPSASSAIEPKSVPPAISATIMTAVSPTTAQVRRSLRSWAAPRKTWSWRQSASVWLCTGGLLFLLQVGLDLALELDGERIALAIDGLADGDPDPALAHAVFLDVGLLLAVELDADALLQECLVVVWALGIGRKAIRQGGGRCRFGHGAQYSGRHGRFATGPSGLLAVTLIERADIVPA